MSLQQAYRGGNEGREGWWLHIRYDEDLVETIKREIPSSMRTWDPYKERWWIAESVAERACGFIKGLEAHLKQPGLL